MRKAGWAVPLMMLAAACGRIGGGDAGGTTPTGQDGTKSFPLFGFDRIEAHGPDIVKVKVGQGFAVTAAGDTGVLDQLEIKAAGGALEIGRRPGEVSTSNAVATITVTLPTLAAATLAGSGDVAVDQVNGNDFAGEVSGSGNLTVDTLKTQYAELSVAGSGDLTVSGTTDVAKLTVAGSGDIHAGGLTAIDLTGNTAGSGGIAARATRTAKLSVVGSGEVHVGGGAKCTISKTGSGDVTCG